MTRMPVLFVGHGSPMNIMGNNSYTRKLNSLTSTIPTPKSILAISAHWETEGTWVTGMENPKTIHDFHGFPQELYEVNYPAPGNPGLAKDIQSQLGEVSVNIDSGTWGLDHGTWAVLVHLFPKADIPVVQLSLDMSKPIAFHYELGTKLRPLREEGVLILGSGNIVHNLRKIDWNKDASPAMWGVEFNDWVKTQLKQGNFLSLVQDVFKTEAGKLSVPTTEHYLPMLYILGTKHDNDDLKIEYDSFQNASISMLSFSFSQ